MLANIHDLFSLKNIDYPNAAKHDVTCMTLRRINLKYESGALFMRFNIHDIIPVGYQMFASKHRIAVFLVHEQSDMSSCTED